MEKTFTRQWRNSKEKESFKEKRGQKKRQVEVYKNLELGGNLLIKFGDLSTYKMFWLFFRVFQPVLWATMAVFPGGCLEDQFEQGKNKYFLSKFETSTR